MKKILLSLLILAFLATPCYAANWKFSYQYPVGSNLQIRADYGARTDSQPEYLCYAQQGTASSATDWLCAKYTYDGNDQMTVKQIAENVSYDDRASATYQ